MEFCCDKFAEGAGRVQAIVEGRPVYPDIKRPRVQFVPETETDDNFWNINGCCGGGCYVVTEMRFCPFCGTKLEHPQMS